MIELISFSHIFDSLHLHLNKTLHSRALIVTLGNSARPKIKWFNTELRTKDKKYDPISMHPFQIDQYFIYPHYRNHTHLPMNKTHTCTSHASYPTTHPSSQPMKEKMDHHCWKLVHPGSVRSIKLLWGRLKIFCLHPKRLKSLTSCKCQSKSSTSIDTTYSYAITQEV